MQWLIDIIAAKVIAEIGIPPVYIDRGDPASADFSAGDFTKDDSWHDLDLSGIVPAGAKGVNIQIIYNNFSSNKHLRFRKKGNSNEYCVLVCKSFTSMGNRHKCGIVACDNDRFIQYRAETAGAWTLINFTVLGWIL